jgi:hypothetical protein
MPADGLSGSEDGNDRRAEGWVGRVAQAVRAGLAEGEVRLKLRGTANSAAQGGGVSERYVLHACVQKRPMYDSSARISTE